MDSPGKVHRIITWTATHCGFIVSPISLFVWSVVSLDSSLTESPSMPDLFAHFASAYLPSRYQRLRQYDALLVLGAALPDLLSRIPIIIFVRFFDLPVVYFFRALHTPIGVILACYTLSFLFERSIRFKSFLLLTAASFLHLVFDLMQEQFFDGVYMPFIPFSIKTVQWGWFHYNASLLVFPLLLVIVLFFWFREKKDNS